VAEWLACMSFLDLQRYNWFIACCNLRSSHAGSNPSGATFSTRNKSVLRRRLANVVRRRHLRSYFAKRLTLRSLRAKRAQLVFEVSV